MNLTDWLLATLLPLVVMTLNFALGSTLTPTSVKNSCGVGPAVCMLGQYGAMPLIAFTLALSLGVSPAQGLGIVVVGCSPGGAMSNLFCYYSNSDVALSIVATTCSSLGTIIALPLLLPFYTQPFETAEGGISMRSILETVSLVVFPVSAGMLVRAHNEDWAKKCENFGSKLGVVFIVAALSAGFISQFSLFFSTWQLWVAVLLLMPIGGTIGFYLAKIAGLPRASCQTVCFETGFQNATFSLTVLEIAYGVTSPVFKEASSYAYMYGAMSYLHAGAFIWYFKRTAAPELDASKGNELTEVA